MSSLWGEVARVECEGDTGISKQEEAEKTERGDLVNRRLFFNRRERSC